MAGPKTRLEAGDRRTELGQSGRRAPVRRLAWAIASVAVLVAVSASPAYAAAGALDPTFDIDGKVTTDFAVGSVGSADAANAVIQYSENPIKLVAGGRSGKDDAFALTRYLDNGLLDPDFGTGGKVTTPFPTPVGFTGVVTGETVHGLARQGDKIVAVGTAFAVPQNDATGTYRGYFALARYLSNGSLDTGFGVGGTVLTGLGGTNPQPDIAFDVAIAPGGAIVVAGQAGGFRNADTDVAVVRYTANGILDPTFGVGGRAPLSIDPVTYQERAEAVVIQPGTNGYTIVVAGTGSTLGDDGLNTTTLAGQDFLVARLTSLGLPDNTFDADGKVLTDVNGRDEAHDVIIHNNKIVVGGGGGGAFALARYNLDGTPDTTFGVGGKVTTDLGGDDEVAGLTTQSGKVVAAGRGGPEADFALARYNDNGSLDTAFDTDGKQTTSFSGGPDAAYAVTTQNDDKVVAAGLDATGSGDFALARYLAT